eukprot:2873551-Amphidinium_carterae.1
MISSQSASRAIAPCIRDSTHTIAPIQNPTRTQALKVANKGDQWSTKLGIDSMKADVEVEFPALRIQGACGNFSVNEKCGASKYISLL